MNYHLHIYLPTSSGDPGVELSPQRKFSVPTVESDHDKGSIKDQTSTISTATLKNID